MKKTLAIVSTLVLMSASAYAADATCQEQATAKKLAGAALKSFMTKCTKDTATASCQKQSADKNLKGAAKTSFETKCVKDATK